VEALESLPEQQTGRVGNNLQISYCNQQAFFGHDFTFCALWCNLVNIHAQVSFITQVLCMFF